MKKDYTSYWLKQGVAEVLSLYIVSNLAAYKQKQLLNLYMHVHLYIIFFLQEALKVSVYYESLCPSSIAFIVNQLYPGYKKLGNLTNIQFIPFGFAHVSSNDYGCSQRMLS